MYMYMYIHHVHRHVCIQTVHVCVYAYTSQNTSVCTYTRKILILMHMHISGDRTWPKGGTHAALARTKSLTALTKISSGTGGIIKRSHLLRHKGN